MKMHELGLPSGVTLCEGRFQVQHGLGAGGMGIVYAAWDHELQRWIAIKTLTRFDAESIYRIKREFRAFAELRHPNLLELYELFEEQGRVFFTMELVPGSGLCDALHDKPASPASDAGASDASSTLPLAADLDYARVRHLFGQVARALSFLHAQGRIHRDIKPDNILVDDRDRAVVLDFGIGATRGSDGALDTDAGGLLGTPAYMAPEMQHTGGDESSDWYAFGVTLYEALTGELPFDERVLLRLEEQKRTKQLAAPAVRVPNTPADLSQLALDLLTPDPAQRPGGKEILRRLHVTSSLRPERDVRAQPRATLMGRAAELERLERALDSVRDEHPKVFLLHGAPGIGKSALARSFLQRCAGDGKNWPLSGSCYEHESVRFKVFDGAIDMLSRQLLALPDDEAARLLPRAKRAAALAAMFPVLARVPVLGSKRRPGRFELPADVGELRKQAFEGLRDVLASIALSHRLVLVVDDVQWGDRDSIALLRALLLSEGAPGLLVVFTYRSDDVTDSPCLQAIMQLRTEAPQLFEDMPLAPLSKDEATTLVRHLGANLEPHEVERLAESAQGSPLLLSELIEAHRAGRRLSDVPSAIETMIEQRVRALSSDARELLELLAIAGRPVPRSVYAVARRGEADLHACVAELRSMRLVRGGASRGMLCSYHEGIRETVVRRLLAGDRSRLHANMARALELQPQRDVDALVHHWRSADAIDRAVGYAEQAAQLASTQLAFARAAALYRFACEHVEDPARRYPLRRAWAEALVLDGRRAEAADVYLTGLNELTDVEAASARQSAGQQLLLSGHPERGLELLRDALSGIGAPLASDVGAALTAWATQHARVSARGLAYVPRRPEHVSSEVAMRLDTLWAAGFGLNRFEGIRVYAALAQHLFEALEHGDTARAVRSLCMYHAIADYPTHLLGGQLLGALATAEVIARDAADPSCEAWLWLARGFEAWFNGRARALSAFEQAASIFRERCAGAAPELGFTHQMIVGLYMATGAWDLANAHCQVFAAEAAQRNDRLFSYVFEQRSVFGALMSGDRAAVSRELLRILEIARDRREETAFPVRFAHGHVSVATADVPAIEAALAWTRRFAKRPEANLPNFRVFVHLNEGRLTAALAQQAHGGARDDLLITAEAALEKAASVGLETSAAVVSLAHAGVALARGKHGLALGCLDDVVAKHVGYNGMLVDLAQYHRARLTGSGPAQEVALRALQARGVADTRLITATMAPGLEPSAD